MKGKLFRFSAGNSRKNGQQVPGKFTSSKQWRRKSISSFKTHSPRVEMPWKCSKLQPLFSPQSLLLKNVWKKNLSTWSGGEFPSFPPLLLMWGVHYSSWGGPPLQKMGGKNARMLFQDNEKSKLEYVKSGIKYIKHHFTKSNCLKLWDAPCWCAAFCQANQLLINPEPRRGKWVSHGFFECWLQIFSLLQSDTSRSFGDVVVHLLGQKISSKCLKAQSHGTLEFETGKIE